ncbi:hypothetical protein GOV12_00580 [Candidatus Pacearchaeota archaeon]|nr:hypothetical protein [Candidatus Pacearchaeota archaeon]
MKKMFEKKEVFVFVILCFLVLTPIVSASILGEIISVWETVIDLLNKLFRFGYVSEDLDGELGSLGAFFDSEEKRFGILDTAYSKTIAPMDNVDDMDYSVGSPNIVPEGPNGEGVSCFEGTTSGGYTGRIDAEFNGIINTTAIGFNPLEYDLLKVQVKASRGAVLRFSLENHPIAFDQTHWWVLDALRGPFDWKTIWIDLNLAEENKVRYNVPDPNSHGLNVYGLIKDTGRNIQGENRRICLGNIRAVKKVIDIDWNQSDFTYTWNNGEDIIYLYPLKVTNLLNEEVTALISLVPFQVNYAVSSLSLDSVLLSPREERYIQAEIRIPANVASNLESLYSERFEVRAKAQGIEDSEVTILRSSDPIHLTITVPIPEEDLEFPILPAISELPSNVIFWDETLARGYAEADTTANLISGAISTGLGDGGAPYNRALIASAYLYNLTGEQKFLNIASELMNALPDIWDTQYDLWENDPNHLVSHGIVAINTLRQGWRIAGTQRSPYQYDYDANANGGTDSAIMYSFDMIASELSEEVKSRVINGFLVPAAIHSRNHYIGDGNQQATVEAVILYSGLVGRNWPLVSFAYSSEHSVSNIIEWTFTDSGVHIRDGYQTYALNPIMWLSEILYAVGINEYSKYEDRFTTIVNADMGDKSYKYIYWWNFVINNRLTSLGAIDSPTNLDAGPVSSTSIKITWDDNSNNEAGFNILRSLNQNSGFNNIATVRESTTTFTDILLTDDTTYYYRVNAFNYDNNGESGYSNTEFAVTSDPISISCGDQGGYICLDDEYCSGNNVNSNDSSRCCDVVCQEVESDSPISIALFGLRRIVSSYNGPLVEVRRESDDEVSDIGFNSSGDLDLIGLESFCAGNCYVRTWYDQTRNVDLNQTDDNYQPKIVSNGNVLVDEIGRPLISFNNDVLHREGETNICSRNLSTYFVQQELCDRTGGYQNVIFAAYNGQRNWAGDWIFLYDLIYNCNSFSLWSGDGNARESTSGGSKTYFRTIQNINFKYQEVNFYRDRTFIVSRAMELNNSCAAEFDIGSYYGNISEIRLYPSLSDEDRSSVHTDINNYYLTSPKTINENAILSQKWQWQVDIYDWLETITEADVTTNIGRLVWDRSYFSVSQLADLWIEMGTKHRGASSILRGEPKWYVLDDGNGAGVEGNGSIRVFRDSASATFFYNLNLSMTNGSQGNPYFQDPALCKRILVLSAVEMIKEDHHTDKYGVSIDFFGGAINGWLYGYKSCRHLLNDSVRDAYEEGIVHISDKLIRSGLKNNLGNMETLGIAALANIYSITDDEQAKDRIVIYVKTVLFGSVNGTPDTTDYNVGLFRKAGYITEGNGPETIYNAQSYYSLTEAFSYTRDDPKWDFLGEVLDKMSDFKKYQHFRDPDGRQNGPSGYAGRTGGSYVNLGYNGITLLTTSASLVNARPFANGFIRNESVMVKNIMNIVSISNSHNIGEPSFSVPGTWGHDHWPDENMFYPESGWYNNLKTLIDSNDSSIQLPYDGQNSFSKTFDNEFWSYKNNDGSKDFGFFVETLEDPGRFKGWYGGSLQTFWTKDAGIIINARHDKSGNNIFDGPENTRIWNDEWLVIGNGQSTLFGIDSWATHHTWGRDENGSAFSTAAINDFYGSGPEITTITYNLTGLNPSVITQTTLGPTDVIPFGPGTRNLVRGEQTGDEIQGIAVFTNKFEAISNGLQITTTVTSNQSDELTELWTTLPIYLREGYHQPNIQDTTIEYWDSDNWINMSNSLVRTGRIRLGRNFNDGQGFRYTYILFSRLNDIKLSDYVWQQTYQEDARIRNIHIDLHGNPGREIMFPARRQIKYAITTTETIGNCVDRDQDGLLDYHSSNCPNGRDLCPFTNKTYFINNQSAVDNYKPEFGNYSVLDVDENSIWEHNNFSISKSNIARILFKNKIRLVRINQSGCFERIRFNRDARFEARKVYLNTSRYMGFNIPADIRFFGISFNDPMVLRDGDRCNDCNITNYNNGILDIEVSGFSEYEIVEDAGDEDTGSPGGSPGGSPSGSPGGSGGSSIGDVELTDEEIDNIEGEIGSQLDEGDVIDFSEDDETDDDNGLDVEESKGSNNLVYYIIFGIVLLLVVLVIVYVFFIKGKDSLDSIDNSGSGGKILKKKEVSRANEYVNLTSKKLK